VSNAPDDAENDEAQGKSTGPSKSSGAPMLIWDCQSPPRLVKPCKDVVGGSPGSKRGKVVALQQVDGSELTHVGGNLDARGQLLSRAEAPRISPDRYPVTLQRGPERRDSGSIVGGMRQEDGDWHAMFSFGKAT
jgi:hypothetical protein